MQSAFEAKCADNKLKRSAKLSYLENRALLLRKLHLPIAHFENDTTLHRIRYYQ